MTTRRIGVLSVVVLACFLLVWLAPPTRHTSGESTDETPRTLSPISAQTPRVNIVETKEDPTLVIHAVEARKIVAPFVLCEDAGAAGGKAIEVPPKAGKEPGAVEIPFTIKQEGMYSIWLRAYWGTDGEGACSNSVGLTVDGLDTATIEDATYETWHWVAYRRGKGLRLSAGLHLLLFRNREDGIRFDQVFITPWYEDEMDRRTPQGVE